MRSSRSMILLLLLLCIRGMAQDPAYPSPPTAPGNVVQAEYYLNTDPGFGLATAIPITPGVDISNYSFPVNTASLIAGFNFLVVRCLSAEGKWSISTIQAFLVNADPVYPAVPAAPSLVNTAEYYIDVDPGFGNGTPVSLTPGVDISNLSFNLNSGSLSAGNHVLYIRSRNENGHWSFTGIRNFLVSFDPVYPLAPAAPDNIVKAEYFIDNDPGFGNGVNIPLSPSVNLSGLNLNIPVSGLTPGVHHLFIRSLNAEGSWSITGRSSFLADENYVYPPAPAAPASIVQAEYFFDDDPGFGNGTAISFTPGVELANLQFEANTQLLPVGVHTLFVRSFGPWGMTGATTFNVGSALPLRLLSFSANSQPQWVDLNWETTNEFNTSHFVIERSAGNNVWQSLGRVESRNAPGNHRYSFRDTDPKTGISLYRLRQADRDSSITYSPVLKVVRNGHHVVLFPNPAKDELNISVPGAGNDMLVELIDPLGRTVYRMNHSNAGNLLRVPVQKLSPGRYVVRISSEGKQWVETFLKM